MISYNFFHILTSDQVQSTPKGIKTRMQRSFGTTSEPLIPGQEFTFLHCQLVPIKVYQCRALEEVKRKKERENLVPFYFPIILLVSSAMALDLGSSTQNKQHVVIISRLFSHSQNQSYIFSQAPTTASSYWRLEL